MALNTDENFPPAGNPPYFISKEWCIGDSLDYINLNSENFDTRLINVSAQINTLSSDILNVTDLETSTIRFGYSYTPTFGIILSADVKQQSLSTLNLGGDITTFGKFLLTSTAIELSTVKDIRYIPPGSPPQSLQVLAYSALSGLWYNETIEGILDKGDTSGINWSDVYGDLRTVSNLPNDPTISVGGRGFEYMPGSVDNEALGDFSISNIKIRDSEIAGGKIQTNTITTNRLAIPVNETNVASNDTATPNTYVLRDSAGDIITRNFKTAATGAALGNSMYNPGGNALAFATDSTERLKVDVNALYSRQNVVVTGSVSASEGFYATNGVFRNSEGNDYLILNSDDDSARFFSNNVELFTITSSGNVGINDSIPEGVLTIRGGSSAGTVPQLVISGGASGSVSDLYVLDSRSVNTGVGFAAKVFGVNIQNQVNTSNEVLQRGTSGGITGAAAIYLGADDVNQGGFGILTSPQGSIAGTVLSERFTVRGDGKVGINTVSPNYLLDVAGDSRFIKELRVQRDTSNSAQYLSFNQDTSVSTAPVVASYSAANNGKMLHFISTTDDLNTTPTVGSNGFVFQVLGDEKLRIQQSGNVGINNPNPNALLAVGPSLGTGSALSPTFVTNTGSLGLTSGNTLKLANIGFETGSKVSLGVKALRYTTGSDWTSTAIGISYDVDNTSPVNNGVVWFRDNGRVGIGTDNPREKLEINGRLSFTSDAGDQDDAGKIDYRGFDGQALSIVGASVTGGDSRIVRLWDSLSVGYGYSAGGMNGIAAAFNGKVGVGQTAPTQNLQVAGFASHSNSEGSHHAIGVVPDGTTTNQTMWLGYDSSADVGYINAAKTGQQRPIILQSRGTGTRPTGNVGIGITNPAGVLDLGEPTSGRALSWGGVDSNHVNIWTSKSNAALVLATGLRGSASTDTYESSQSGGSRRRNAIRLNYTSDEGIQFFSNTAATIAVGGAVTPDEMVRITPQGISITEPSAVPRNAIAPLTFTNQLNTKIDLYHNTSGSGDRYGIGVFSGELRIHSGQSGSGTGGITFGKQGTASSTFTEHMRIRNDGRIGIGTTTPTATLDVNGDFRVRNSIITNNIRADGGTQVVINVGESSIATGQTDERLYVNAENGLEINSSPDNWLPGTGAWDRRYTAIICDRFGNSSFPNHITVGEQITAKAASSSYISQHRGGSALQLSNTGASNTFSGWLSQRTPSGGFVLGTISDTLRLNWATNTNINNNTNNITNVFSIDSNGNVDFTGTLNSGTVPWARLSNVPGIVYTNNDITKSGRLTIYNNAASLDVFNGGIEIREVNLVANGQSSANYAPALTFHWGNRHAAKIRMDSDGHFRFQAQGTNTASYRDIYVNKVIASSSISTAGVSSSQNITVTSGNLYVYGHGNDVNQGVLRLNSSGTRYLYYNGTNYIMPGGELYVNNSRAWTDGNLYSGQMLRVASGSYTDQVDLGSTIGAQNTWWTAFQVTLNRLFNTSHVLVQCMMSIGAYGPGYPIAVRVIRSDGSVPIQGQVAAGASWTAAQAVIPVIHSDVPGTAHIQFLDTGQKNYGNQITYNVQVAIANTTYDGWTNRGRNPQNNNDSFTGISTLTLTEVKA